MFEPKAESRGSYWGGWRRRRRSCKEGDNGGEREGAARGQIDVRPHEALKAKDEFRVLNRGMRHVSSRGGGVISGHAITAGARLESRSAPSPAFSRLTSMSSGSRVILCIGRMRKEIMGRFLQSGWPSILVSTSLKTAFLEL